MATTEPLDRPNTSKTGAAFLTAARHAAALEQTRLSSQQQATDCLEQIARPDENSLSSHFQK